MNLAATKRMQTALASASGFISCVCLLPWLHDPYEETTCSDFLVTSQSSWACGICVLSCSHFEHLVLFPFFLNASNSMPAKFNPFPRPQEGQGPHGHQTTSFSEDGGLEKKSNMSVAKGVSLLQVCVENKHDGSAPCHTC